jgi:hypothetical protein
MVAEGFTRERTSARKAMSGVSLSLGPDFESGAT